MEHFLWAVTDNGLSLREDMAIDILLNEETGLGDLVSKQGYAIGTAIDDLSSTLSCRPESLVKARLSSTNFLSTKLRKCCVLSIPVLHPDLADFDDDWRPNGRRLRCRVIDPRGHDSSKGPAATALA